MHTFYVTAGQLDKEDARHASRVLRLKAGDEITALSEGARYRARIAQLSDKAGAVELLEELPANESPLSITLYQGLPKAEKLEFLAQKLTELGVARLTPVRMARSVAKGEGDQAHGTAGAHRPGGGEAMPPGPGHGNQPRAFLEGSAFGHGKAGSDDRPLGGRFLHPHAGSLRRLPPGPGYRHSRGPGGGHLSGRNFRMSPPGR